MSGGTGMWRNTVSCAGDLAFGFVVVGALAVLPVTILLFGLS